MLVLLALLVAKYKYCALAAPERRFTSSKVQILRSGVLLALLVAKYKYCAQTALWRRSLLALLGQKVQILMQPSRAQQQRALAAEDHIH